MGQHRRREDAQVIPVPSGNRSRVTCWLPEPPGHSSRYHRRLENLHTCSDSFQDWFELEIEQGSKGPVPSHPTLDSSLPGSVLALLKTCQQQGTPSRQRGRWGAKARRGFPV